MTSKTVSLSDARDTTRRPGAAFWGQLPLGGADAPCPLGGRTGVDFIFTMVCDFSLGQKDWEIFCTKRGGHLGDSTCEPSKNIPYASIRHGVSLLVFFVWCSLGLLGYFWIYWMLQHTGCFCSPNSLHAMHTMHEINSCTESMMHSASGGDFGATCFAINKRPLSVKTCAEKYRTSTTAK